MVKIRSLLIREWVLFTGLILVLLFSLWWWGFIHLADAQAAAQATASLQGLGLGLDYATRAIRKHRGHLGVRSEDGWTCFRVRLPLDQFQAY